MDGKKQVWVTDKIYCWIDLDTLEVYSAKLRKLKGQHMPEHNMTYYMLKNNGFKKYIAVDNIVAIAKGE